MPSITADAHHLQGEQDPSFDDSGNLHIVTETTEQEENEKAYEEYMRMLKQQLEQNWQGGYTQTPDEVEADPTLPSRAKRVYRALVSFMWFKTDKCFPSQETLAERTGLSRSTIIRALKDLYERGYIERWRRGQGDTNYYFINPLSFVRSFKPAMRGRGVRLQVRELHTTTVENTPAPRIPLCGLCQVDTSESSNLTQQGVSNCNTNHTKTEQINSTSISSNHSTSPSGRVVAGATIRKDSEKRATGTPTTTRTEGTNPSPHTATQPKPNQNEKLSDELAAPRRAKEALTQKMGKPYDGGAAQIAQATGIPAEHLTELGVALERRKRPIPDFIERVIADFSVELGDNPRSHKGSVTRATKIYYTALAIFTDIQDDPEGHFLRMMYDARTAAKHITNVRHHTGTRTNRMPAFFTCLENQFGFQPEELEYLRSDEPLYYAS